MRDNRDQIAHLELIDPKDFARFKELGVIANFQLLWAERDSYITSATMPYIGPERSRYLYPARSLRDAGALIAGGSDWGVSSFNPFEAMEHAITRREARGREPLLPEQSISLQDIVDAYTINAAFALKQERTTGSLEPGKRADFIVLDRDIFAIDPLRSARHPGALDLPRRARGLHRKAVGPRRRYASSADSNGYSDSRRNPPFSTTTMSSSLTPSPPSSGATMLSTASTMCSSIAPALPSVSQSRS